MRVMLGEISVSGVLAGLEPAVAPWQSPMGRNRDNKCTYGSHAPTTECWAGTSLIKGVVGHRSLDGRTCELWHPMSRH